MRIFETTLRACTLAVILLSGQAGAETAKFNSFDHPYFGRVDEPLRISVLQPAPRFFEALTRFDQAGIINLDSQEWHTFSDADVWVYFLKDETDLFMLRDEMRATIDMNYDGQGLGYVTGVTVQIDGEVRQIMMAHYFIDKFEHADLDQIGCLTAVFLFDEISQQSEFRRQAEIARCGGIEEDG